MIVYSDSVIVFKQPVKLKRNKGLEGEGLIAFISHADIEQMFVSEVKRQE